MVDDRLIMLGSIVNYLTRGALSVTAPTLLKDLHIGAQQYSWIVGEFQERTFSPRRLHRRRRARAPAGEVDYKCPRFVFSVGGGDWQWLPEQFDTSALSDEAEFHRGVFRDVLSGLCRRREPG